MTNIKKYDIIRLQIFEFFLQNQCANLNINKRKKLLKKSFKRVQLLIFFSLIMQTFIVILPLLFVYNENALFDEILNKVDSNKLIAFDWISEYMR